MWKVSLCFKKAHGDYIHTDTSTSNIYIWVTWLLVNTYTSIYLWFLSSRIKLLSHLEWFYWYLKQWKYDKLTENISENHRASFFIYLYPKPPERRCWSQTSVGIIVCLCHFYWTGVSFKKTQICYWYQCFGLMQKADDNYYFGK